MRGAGYVREAHRHARTPHATAGAYTNERTQPGSAAPPTRSAPDGVPLPDGAGTYVACGTPPTPVFAGTNVPEGAGSDVAAATHGR